MPGPEIQNLVDSVKKQVGNVKVIQVIFFDLGETLVTKDKQWVDGAKAILSKLGQKGIRLGIISNTADLTRTEILQLLPSDFDIGIFDQELVIFSSEAGVEKPDPQIFQQALSKAGIATHEILFCTENLVDTLVAQQVGLRTARTLPPPTADISNLVENMMKAGLLT